MIRLLFLSCILSFSTTAVYAQFAETQEYTLLIKEVTYKQTLDTASSEARFTVSVNAQEKGVLGKDGDNMAAQTRILLLDRQRISIGQQSDAGTIDVAFQIWENDGGDAWKYDTGTDDNYSAVSGQVTIGSPNFQRQTYRLSNSTAEIIFSIDPQ